MLTLLSSFLFEGRFEVPKFLLQNFNPTKSSFGLGIVRLKLLQLMVQRLLLLANLPQLGRGLLALRQPLLQADDLVFQTRV